MASQPQYRSNKRDISGILLLDKPKGLTSNRALQTVKRLFNAKKAGHTGSLDPLASGMLPLCFGQATKVSALLLDADKIYEVEASIGSRTDTADADGTVTETAAKQVVTPDELEAALKLFHGEIEQVPPMYSALKHEGKRLYVLAREGIEVERKARKLTIHSLEIVHFDPAAPVLRVHCSKGTYIRSLVEDIAAALGTLAHVSMLRRIAVEPFGDRPMVTVEQLEAQLEAGDPLEDYLLPADVALQVYPAVELGASEVTQLLHGHTVNYPGDPVAGTVRIYGPEGLFLGIGLASDAGQVAPKRLFVGSPSTVQK